MSFLEKGVLASSPFSSIYTIIINIFFQSVFRMAAGEHCEHQNIRNGSESTETETSCDGSWKYDG